MSEVRPNNFEDQMQHMVEQGGKCGHVYIRVCANADGTYARGCPTCRRLRNRGKSADKGVVQDFHESEQERQFQSLSITANRIKGKGKA